jgi:hypothetical protein
MANYKKVRTVRSTENASEDLGFGREEQLAKLFHTFVTSSAGLRIQPNAPQPRVEGRLNSEFPGV